MIYSIIGLIVYSIMGLGVYLALRLREKCEKDLLLTYLLYIYSNTVVRYETRNINLANEQINKA